MTPVSVPSLDELLADPARAASLPPEVARALWLRCLQVQAALAPALLANGHPHEVQTEQPLLDVEAAAQRLAVSSDWLYRRAAKLPFTVRLGRTLRFSARGIDQYIRQRQGRQRHIPS